MESLLEDLAVQRTDDGKSKHLLKKFAEKNQTSFQVIGSAQIKQDLVNLIFDNIRGVTSNSDGESSLLWSPSTQIQALTVLRILSRGKEENSLCKDDSLKQLAELADVSGDKMMRSDITKDEIDVIVEAIKCFCNIFLNHKNLIYKSVDLGILSCLVRRLDMHINHHNLSYEMIYYDLRLLFLITACDSEKRSLFRDEHNGILIVTNIIGKTLNCTAYLPPSSAQLATPTNEDMTTPLSRPLTDQDMNLLCEALKILFNQTFDWRKEDDKLLPVMNYLGTLIRLLLISLPCQTNAKSLQLISHVSEVLLNFPPSCASSLLLPLEKKATPTLIKLYPNLYPAKSIAKEGGVVSGVGVVYTLDIDKEFEGWNLAPILALINMLYIRLSGDPGRNSIPTLLSSLIAISKGNRIIRRFLKKEILPPLGKVVQRPDEGDSLKSKIIRLLTAASPYGAEEVAGELLFILCKENASRLVKYTGYGRAAGLLMAHGLLGGGISPGQSNYSSDEKDSDTDEYLDSQDKIDPMTGGPSTTNEKSPLDEMTDEEKEEEARKLHDLIEKLNEKGIIKMAPLDSENKPITFPPPSPSQDN